MVSFTVLQGDIIIGYMVGTLSYTYSRRWDKFFDHYGWPQRCEINGEGEQLFIPASLNNVYNGFVDETSIFDVKIIYDDGTSIKLKDLYIKNGSGSLYLSNKIAVLQNFEFKSF